LTESRSFRNGFVIAYLCNSIPAQKMDYFLLRISVMAATA
jgi:hypothetical protein